MERFFWISLGVSISGGSIFWALSSDASFAEKFVALGTILPFTAGLVWLAITIEDSRG